MEDRRERGKTRKSAKKPGFRRAPTTPDQTENVFQAKTNNEVSLQPEAKKTNSVLLEVKKTLFPMVPLIDSLLVMIALAILQMWLIPGSFKSFVHVSCLLNGRAGI